MSKFNFITNRIFNSYLVISTKTRLSLSFKQFLCFLLSIAKRLSILSYLQDSNLFLLATFKSKSKGQKQVKEGIKYVISQGFEKIKKVFKK